MRRGHKETSPKSMPAINISAYEVLILSTSVCDWSGGVAQLILGSISAFSKIGFTCLMSYLQSGPITKTGLSDWMTTGLLRLC